MATLTEKIIALKKFKRTNFFFYRRRIEKGNGKKTLGWVLENENKTNHYENIDISTLKDKLLVMEASQ